MLTLLLICFAGVFQDMVVIVQSYSPGGSHVSLARPISAQLSVTSCHIACFHYPALSM